MAIDWNQVLGPENSDTKRAAAIASLNDMVANGVGEPYALEVVKRIFAKSEIIVGERQQLIAEAIASVSKRETADIKGMEKRVMPAKLQDPAFKAIDTAPEAE